ncbi:hypothetical protein [Ignavibacterium album]|uniref:hypothetical protein n=1 Tax=Ignavibacterium album TaxID=591197 RepID=UPI0035BB9191
MIYNQISQIVFIIFLVLSIYFTSRKNYQALLALFVAGIGFGGFNIYYGTLWFPYKIVSVFIVLVVLINSGKKIFPKYFKKLIVLFVISVIIALIFQPSIDQTNLPFFQRSSFRPFVQLFTYVSLAALIPFCLLVLKTENHFLIFIKRYFLIVELVMSFAVLQFIIQKLGMDFMPILRPNLTDSPTAAFSFQNTIILRLYGVTGEPKTLAAFLSPYFFTSLYNFYNKNYNRNNIYHLIMLLISLFVIINSFSSAVLLSLAITLSLASLIWFRNKIKILVPMVALILVLLYSNPGQTIISRGYIASSYSLYDLLVERTTGRLTSEMNERPEYIGINYLFNVKPYLSFTGIGMGMYPYYVTSSGSYGIDPIDSNWVIFLMDFGLLGVGLLLYNLIKLLGLRNKIIYKQDKQFNFALIGLFAAYVLGLGVGSYQYMMLFTGLAFSAYKIKKNKLSNKNSSDNMNANQS